MKKALIFLLAVLLLSSMLAAAWAEDPLHRLFGEGEPDVLGEPFPDFTVKDTKKNEFTLSEALKDHEAVLINFFASWCGPCIRELPLLNELYNQYGDRVAFIGLDFEPDDTLLDIVEIRIENKVPFPMGKTAGTGLNEYLGVFRLPQTVVIDRFGNLCFMRISRWCFCLLYHQTRGKSRGRRASVFRISSACFFGGPRRCRLLLVHRCSGGACKSRLRRLL